VKTVLLIGNLTTDAGDGTPRDGGAVYYAAAAATRLGWRALCVTRAVREPSDVPADIASLESWHVVPAKSTTTFRNLYGRDGSRTQAVLTPVPTIAPEDVPLDWRNPDAIHLAPVAGELGADILDGLSAPFIGVGAQGWLRTIGPKGMVSASAWAVPQEILARTTAVAVSEEDLAGEGRPPDELARGVPLMAVTRGRAGATIFADRARVELEPLGVQAVDPTGAGDIFAATFFLLLAEGFGAAEAGRHAAIAASLSVESIGLGGLRSRADIERIARQP
jgi:sugar/nucleoside kinase (ribokinase family)